MGRTVTYEEVLKWTGELGVYQLMIFFYIIGYIFVSVEPIYMNFIGYKIDHWCKVPELAEFSFETQKHVAIPYSANSSDGKVSYENCKMFDLNYSSHSPEDFLNWQRPQDVKTIECSSWVFDQSVYSKNIVNEWELVCGKSWQVDFVSTMTLVGFLFGSIVGGALSDRLGRIKAMGISIVLKMAANVFSTVAPNYIAFVIARFCVGFATQYSYVVGFVITIENLGKAHRPWMGIAYTLSYSLGFSCVPLFALACRDWRDLQIVMTAPTAIYLFTIWFLPESPRWLLCQGKLKEADAGIRQIAAVNNQHLPEDFKVTDIQIECNTCPSEKKSTFDSSAKNHLPDDLKATNIKFDCEPSPNDRKATFVDLFKTPKIRKYTFILFVIWICMNLIYFALSLNAAFLPGDVFLNTSLLGLVEVPAGLLCFIIMGLRITGRNRTLALANLIGGVACLICVPIIIADEDSVAVTVLSLIGKAGSNAAFAGFYVYTSEIYPTEVRNVGLGACSMVARFSGIAAPYIGGFFGDVWRPMPSLIFGIAGTGCGLLTFLLPETFGKNLPETIEELERGALEKRKPVIESVVDNNIPDEKYKASNSNTDTNFSKQNEVAMSIENCVEGSEPPCYEKVFSEKM